jgi:nitroreductase
VELEDAIRGRRTHKAYAPEPVERELLDELFDLARWAPNHHLTNPWRFRVVGPESLKRLKAAAGPEAGPKLDRAPTLVCASVKLTGDPVQDEEDLCATACAVFIVLLTPDGAAAVGMEPDELFVGLIHLGPARQAKEPPERLPPNDFVTYLS